MQRRHHRLASCFENNDVRMVWKKLTPCWFRFHMLVDHRFNMKTTIYFQLDKIMAWKDERVEFFTSGSRVFIILKWWCQVITTWNGLGAGENWGNRLCLSNKSADATLPTVNNPEMTLWLCSYPKPQTETSFFSKSIWDCMINQSLSHVSCSISTEWTEWISLYRDIMVGFFAT